MDIAFEKYLKNTCVQLIFTSNIKINMQITRSLGKQTRLNLCKPWGKKIWMYWTSLIVTQCLNLHVKPLICLQSIRNVTLGICTWLIRHVILCLDFFSTWVMRFSDYQNNYILVALIWQFMSECVIKGNNSCTSDYFWFHGSIGSFLTDV